jgi:hypothetical protein
MTQRARITLLATVTGLTIAGAGTGIAAGQSSDSPSPIPPPQIATHRPQSHPPSSVVSRN